VPLPRPAMREGHPPGPAASALICAVPRGDGRARSRTKTSPSSKTALSRPRARRGSAGSRRRAAPAPASRVRPSPRAVAPPPEVEPSLAPIGVANVPHALAEEVAGQGLGTLEGRHPGGRAGPAGVVGDEDPLAREVERERVLEPSQQGLPGAPPLHPGVAARPRLLKPGERDCPSAPRDRGGARPPNAPAFAGVGPAGAPRGRGAREAAARAAGPPRAGRGARRSRRGARGGRRTGRPTSSG